MTKASKPTSRRQTRTPKASSPAALARMKNARRRDTSCELAIRSLVHRAGLRFRVDWPLPSTRRRADLAFTKARVAVFVDGCFWHSCPLHATWPTANAAWWKAKLETNRRRDRDTVERLQAMGWKAVRFWEHEDAKTAARKIVRVVRARSLDRSH